jgi:integrase/recombinase XerD
MILWRRHTAPCESTDRSDPRCGCPIYQEYRLNGRRFRKTLKTTNWQKALADARRKELEGFKDKKSPTIEQACEKYLQDATSRQLREPTLYKFRLLFRQIQDFAKDKGLVFVSDFNLDYLRQFRAAWTNKNEAARVKLGNLRAFFRFCHKSKWIDDNPALDLKPGKIAPSKIVPLTHEEFKRILDSCDSDKKYVQRLRALILVLRFTGLSIRDAITLRRDAIQHGKMFLRRAKTDVNVYCPLPRQVLEALATLPNDTDYFFWSGSSKPKSAVGDYQRALRRVFRQAGVPKAYPHLFRHTFATQLLQDGVSVQSVATLLGHSSTKITERSYSHWIQGRQTKLEDEVKNSWAQMGTADVPASESR